MISCWSMSSSFRKDVSSSCSRERSTTRAPRGLSAHAVLHPEEASRQGSQESQPALSMMRQKAASRRVPIRLESRWRFRFRCVCQISLYLAPCVFSGSFPQLKFPFRYPHSKNKNKKARITVDFFSKATYNLTLVSDIKKWRQLIER